MVFNAANILLVAAIDIAGMAVAFPVGIGLALVLGVVVNYESGRANPLLLFTGVAFIVAAILLDALAYRRLPGEAKAHARAKGLILAVACGILMGFFYRFVARAMSSDSSHFVTLDAGKMGPYAAVFFFSIGMLVSNLVFNTLLMVRPFRGSPLRAADYLAERPGSTWWACWAARSGASAICSASSPSASPDRQSPTAWAKGPPWSPPAGECSYGANSATRRRGTGLLLALMFAGYVIGLTLVIAARVG